MAQWWASARGTIGLVRRDIQNYADQPESPESRRTHIEDLSVFFFPRPWRPNWEVPKEHDANAWSFGAFEMGGFFVQGDKSVYDALAHDDLCDFVRLVNIFRRSGELDRSTRLLVDLAPAPDTKAKIDSYVQQSG